MSISDVLEWWLEKKPKYVIDRDNNLISEKELIAQEKKEEEEARLEIIKILKKDLTETK